MAKHIISRRRLANMIRSAGALVCCAEALERRMLLTANPYQWPLGPETRVNTYFFDNQRAPATAMDADGNYVIAWTSESQDGAFGGIYAQRYNAAGAPQGDEFRVNTFTGLNERQPAVAMDSNGDFVVAWNSGLDADYFYYSPYNIRAKRYNAAGEQQGAEFIVNTDREPTTAKFAPAVAMDADGDFAITWTANHQDTFYSSIYSQRFSASGAKLGGEVHVNSGTQGEYNSVISMDADGDYVIAWTSYGRDGSDFAVYAQRFNAAGVRQGLEFLVNTHTTGRQRDPTVAMDSDGDFVIAWHSSGKDASFYGVYAQRYNAVGVRQGAEFRVNTLAHANYPSAAMDADGNFLITWHGFGVLGQRYSALGAALGSEFRLNTQTALGSRFTSAAMDSNGDFVVTWQGYYGVEGGYAADISSQRYTTFGPASTATIGDRVWDDTDADGIQDAAEPGIAGAVVDLLNSDGAFVTTTLTNGSGNYSFQAFAGASAIVRFVAPTGLIHTRQNQGANDDVDSDASRTTGRTPVFTIGASGTTNNSFDAGFSVPASVSGVVFNDRNGNGLRDGSDEALQGFQVFVDFDSDGVRDGDEPLDDVDASGNYSFSGLLGGSYRIVVMPQDLWVVPAFPPVAIAPGAALTHINLPVRTSVPDKSSLPHGPEFRVNSYTTGDQNFSSIAMDSAGNFVVAWSGSGAGDDAGIFAQRYNAAGVKQGSEFRINSFTTGSQRDPSAAMDSDGDFVVTWTSHGQDGAGSGIYAQRFNAAGAAQGTEFRVNTYTTSDQTSPAAAMDASGDFVIAWQSDGQNFDLWETYAQRYNAQGVPQGAEFRANTDTYLSQSMPAVAMDADGDFVIAWAKGYGGYYGIPYDIFAQRFNAAGVKQGTEFRVNTYTTSSQFGPSVAMDADGDFVIAWQSFYQDDSHWGVYAQRYNAAAVKQGTEFRVNSITGGNATAPSATMNADGDLIIAWHGAGITAQRYNAAGVKHGAELHINTHTAGGKELASAAIDSGGDFVVAWQSLGQDGSGSGVYAQRYTGFTAATSVTIGDRVWNDANGNGIQDGGEAGIAGAIVELYNSDGVFAAATTTDATGHYSFSVLAGSSVYVRFITPAGFISTRVNHGANDSLDSDADRVTGQSPQFTAGAAGSSNNTLDAGFVVPASVNGMVFNDRSGDGIRNGGEEALRGFEVFADLDLDGVRDADEPVGDTDPDGSYHLQNLLNGTHSIVVVDQDRWVEPAHSPVAVPVGGAVTEINLSVRTTALDSTSQPQGGEFRTNTYTTLQQSDSVVAMDATGNYVVAWNSYRQDGSLWGIYAQRYNAAGAKQGNEFRVNTYTTGFQGYPGLAMDAVGGFVITWSGEGSGDSNGIFGQRYNAAGVKQGTEFRINTFTTGAQYNPSAAIDPDGNFVVAWYSYEQDGSLWGVYAQRYNAAGTKQGNEFRANSYTTGAQVGASVAMDSAGNFVIAWSGPGQGGNSTDVYAQRYNASGVPQSGEFRVNFHTTGDQNYPSVAMNPAGDFAVTWYGDGQGDSGNDIYARRYNAAGVAQGSDVRVNSYTTGSQSSPSAAMNADGDLVVTWASYLQDGGSEGIYAQRYNAAGLPQGLEFRVNSFITGHQLRPGVAMDPAGRFVVAWTSRDQDGSDEGVYAHRYSTSLRPSVTANQFIWNSGPPRIEFTFDQDVSASLSSADLVLENFTTSTTIPTASIAKTWNAATKTVTFTFPTLPNGGSLTDGDYRATLVAGGVNNSVGTTIATNYAVQFFVLAGDANHDRRVDVADLGILATNWQQSPRTFSQGDFNYDGSVDVADLGILATNWQHSPTPRPDAQTAPLPRTRTVSRLIDQLVEMSPSSLRGSS